MTRKRHSSKIGRRDFLKAAAGVPVLAAFGLGIANARQESPASANGQPLNLNIVADPPPPLTSLAGEPIRVALIGAGRRGSELLQLCLQPELNVRVTGICDIYDLHAERALDLAHKSGHRPRRFRHYGDAIDSNEADAIIIATPDHWHAPMAIDAAYAGKDIYLEGCMTHRIGETFTLRNALVENGNVFQLGHQQRQLPSLSVARNAVDRQALGHVCLVQASANHDGDFVAWNLTVDPSASVRNVDWHQFLGNAPARPFNPEHLFRWRKWWGYGSGISGDLFAQEFDRINGILQMGIPRAVTASGGIYAYQDGREVPDVLQIGMEFPDYHTGATDSGRGLSFIYSATLGSGYRRGTLLMGRDATMELGHTLRIHADPHSQRYPLHGNAPIFVYTPNTHQFNTVARESLGYFSEPTMELTYRDGKLFDATYLHFREWLSCIRHGGKTSCGIDEGFDAAITAHLATIAYRLGKRVEWDHTKGQLKNVAHRELESIRMV